MIILPGLNKIPIHYCDDSVGTDNLMYACGDFATVDWYSERNHSARVKLDDVKEMFTVDRSRVSCWRCLQNLLVSSCPENPEELV